ncbi:MAG TPA: alpha/beta fold hydrolase [Candidatus Angelobacter sp.]|nr:alpha/beta fold hydrolase [Candidatus Angelobacter sp.]
MIWPHRVWVCALLVGYSVAAAQGGQGGPASPPSPEYQTVFYNNGNLRLEAYFYKPQGNGPFPVVVYNHGSRAGFERAERPMAFIARVLVLAGYAVLVPERRGYGKSDGATFAEEIGSDRGERFVRRLEAEAADVNAAVDYAKAQLPIDAERIGVIGYSFGGIVTTLAAARSKAFVAVVNQAPGALNWDRSPLLRQELLASAEKIKTSMVCMAAKNDATTENVRSICAKAQAHGAATDVIIYPPFTDARFDNPTAPGHAIFFYGVDIWRQDVLNFLAKYLKPDAHSPDKAATGSDH